MEQGMDVRLGKGTRGYCGRTAQRIVLIALVATVVGTPVAGCSRRWAIPLQIDGRGAGSLTAQGWNAARRTYPDEVADGDLVPLDRLLAEAGVEVAESVALEERRLAWAAWAEDTWVARDGRVLVGEEDIGPVTKAAVTSPPEAALVTATHLDLAPTIAGVLGVPSPRKTQGRALEDLRADHVVLVILDGLGYRLYVGQRGTGGTPFLDSLGEPRLVRGVYPSITRVSMAAMLSGAAPSANGVADRSSRDIAAETILQVVTASGRCAVVVEGESLPVNLPGATFRLSGDRDGNGYTDDNTRDSALAVVAEGMPDLLVVHWHGIDDAGHTYGPASSEYQERLSTVDGYLHQLVSVLPQNTLVLITADHGMHAVSDGEGLGNHGTLSTEDMLVPLWMLVL